MNDDLFIYKNAEEFILDILDNPEKNNIFAFNTNGSIVGFHNKKQVLTKKLILLEDTFQKIENIATPERNRIRNSLFNAFSIHNPLYFTTSQDDDNNLGETFYIFLPNLFKFSSNFQMSFEVSDSLEGLFAVSCSIGLDTFTVCIGQFTFREILRTYKDYLGKNHTILRVEAYKSLKKYKKYIENVIVNTQKIENAFSFKDSEKLLGEVE